MRHFVFRWLVTTVAVMVAASVLRGIRYDTVGGLIARRLGRVPIPGARATVQGWDLTAESAAGRRNRIGTVLAEPVTPVDDDTVTKDKPDA